MSNAGEKQTPDAIDKFLLVLAKLFQGWLTAGVGVAIGLIIMLFIWGIAAIFSDYHPFNPNMCWIFIYGGGVAGFTCGVLA